MRNSYQFDQGEAKPLKYGVAHDLSRVQRDIKKKLGQYGKYLVEKQEVEYRLKSNKPPPAGPTGTQQTRTTGLANKDRTATNRKSVVSNGSSQTSVVSQFSGSSQLNGTPQSQPSGLTDPSIASYRPWTYPSAASFSKTTAANCFRSTKKMYLL